MMSNKVGTQEILGRKQIGKSRKSQAYSLDYV